MYVSTRYQCTYNYIYTNIHIHTWPTYTYQVCMDPLDSDERGRESKSESEPLTEVKTQKQTSRDNGKKTEAQRKKETEEKRNNEADK